MIMHVFIKPPKDDGQIKTCHGQSNSGVNTVLLLILSALFPVPVLMKPHTLTICTCQNAKEQDKMNEIKN
jgi:hypothetical protein